jgi:fatty acid desaturase
VDGAPASTPAPRPRARRQSARCFPVRHHDCPDLPAHRYAEIALEVREVCERYGIPYNTGPLSRQFGSVVSKIVRLALPPIRGGRQASGKDRARAASSEV